MRSSSTVFGDEEFTIRWGRALCATLCLFLMLVFGPRAVSAADNPQVAARKQVTAIKKQLGEAAELIRKRRADEAKRLVDEAEQQLEQLVSAGSLKADSESASSVKKIIALRRKALASKMGKNEPSAEQGGVSYAKEVAPILTKHCAGCHAGDDAKGGLKVDSLAALKRGGQSGRPAIIGGQAAKSLLVERLNASGEERMPKGKPPLSRGEIETITRWINAGARADGDDSATTPKPMPAAGKPSDRTVEVAMAVAGDKISFTRDIAPFLVNICLGCHSGEMPRGSLSMETFEKLLQGGKSGGVLVAGSTEKSRLFRLTGGLELPRMPASDARITRKNYEDLKTWIEEGLHYDGKDPRAALRSLVPSADAQKSRELAGMSAEQLVAMRTGQLRDIWKRVSTKSEPQVLERPEFILLGQVQPERLEAIAQQADAMLLELRRTFGDKSQPAWKGKLGIFVMRDRFSFEEFQLVVHKRRVPREVLGHAVVSPSGDEAYIVVQDVADEATPDLPGGTLNLRTQLARAFVLRWTDAAPEWLLGGTALAAATTNQPQSGYIDSLKRSLKDQIAKAGSPEALIEQKSLSPQGSASVNLGLVNTLVAAGGMPKFVRLWTALHEGQTVDQALQAVYQAKPVDIASQLAAGGGR